MNKISQYAIQLINIHKMFPGVIALNDVSLNIRQGEVHALIGENGAGKSTLMKIIAGIVKPDSGKIVLNGTEVSFHKPADALNAGISMIHQELNLISEMTIEQNLFIGREIGHGLFGVVKRKQLREKAVKLFKEMDIIMDPDAKISTLSVAGKQMVEIIKAISYNANIIIMDEPTSSINEQEVKKLFNIIKILKSKGTSIIYISHKMDEISVIADRITVLRDGNYITTKESSDLDKQSMISLMVGRDLKDMYVKEYTQIGEVVLKVNNLTRQGIFRDITFELHKGEILGFAGLVGASRTEVVESIFGLHKNIKGEIFFNQKKVRFRRPKDAIRKGIALVTEDRKLFGLNLISSVKDNITLVNLNAYAFLKIIIDSKSEIDAADKQIKLLNIKTYNRNVQVGTLSGGNQQKVVLAKWLLCAPDVIILDEPTRGIDVGAKAEIYKIMTHLAASGKSIIMISSEMPELLAMSDRILVLHNGGITGEFTRDEFDQEQLMSCAMGHNKEENV